MLKVCLHTAEKSLYFSGIFSSTASIKHEFGRENHNRGRVGASGPRLNGRLLACLRRNRARLGAGAVESEDLSRGANPRLGMPAGALLFLA